MDYSIWINNEKIPVSEDVYRVYWKGARKERYFSEGDMHNHVFSYDALDTEDINGEDIFSNAQDVPIDEQVILKLEKQQLYKAIEKLPPKDYMIIYSLYFRRVSLRKLSDELGLAPSTLHYRHHAILKRLKGYLDAEGYSSHTP